MYLLGVCTYLSQMCYLVNISVGLNANVVVNYCANGHVYDKTCYPV